MTENYIWCEKYRPNNFANYVGNDAMKAKFASYITNQDLPHILLTGPAGTGKTTAAKILVNSIECDSMCINASDENNIETVRSKIKGFASTAGFNNLKIIFLDEFDGFTRQGQEALRNLMEAFSNTTRFILTANYIERISGPIVSRTQHFEVEPPSKLDVAKHIVNILKKEEVEFAPVDLKIIIEAYFPDIRKIINECQLSTHEGKLQPDTRQIVENDYKLKIIDLLKSKTNPKEKFTTIRQVVANNKVRDFSLFYRTLYDHVADYASGNVSAVILKIAEGQYRDALVVDKEINAMATVVEILGVVS
jgi:DNA polymerase III delta prime subunit